jgi:hypothetical protein
LIYLDQFAISNLMKLVTPTAKGHEKVKADPFWRELLDLLTQLRHLQLIVCGSSESHETESLLFGLEDALRRTYQSLGSGNSFVNFNQIEIQQIAELAYAWAESRDPKFAFAPSEVLRESPDAWSGRIYIATGRNPFMQPDGVRRTRDERHAHIVHLFNDVWGKEKHPFRYWYDLERTQYQRWIGTAAAKSSQRRRDAALSRPLSGEPSLEELNTILPSYAESVFNSLTRIFALSRDGKNRSTEEASRLLHSFVESNRIAEAPSVKLSALMYAAIAMRVSNGQKEPPNIGTTTDIETVAHLLPYCDLMFIDNGCRSLFIDIPRDLRPGWSERLFSMNNRIEFLNRLREIRDSISQKQLDAIREVYGDSYAEGVTAKSFS